MIHVDTHVVMWIAGGMMRRFSATARRLIERESLVVSPMLILELETLFERGDSPTPADATFAFVAQRANFSVSPAPFDEIVTQARTLAWTRDPFDRLIVANALADGARLLTADGLILENFVGAVW